MTVHLEPGGLSQAMPAILAALREQLPDDPQSIQKIDTAPLAELVLELEDPAITTKAGERRVRAMATLRFEPADPAARPVSSRRFRFTAPLGSIEADDLRWYLEEYFYWPVGVFKERAERIEAQLPKWGQALYEAALGAKSAAGPLQGWQQAANGTERRFSIYVEAEPPEDSSPAKKIKANEAASALLSLPWELLHDGRSYLFQGKNPVRVRRRLPNRRSLDVRLTELPIRILLASPRPEDERTGYIDHRASALPLVTAVEQLGDLADLTVLTPPTLPALEQALQRAEEAGQPFDVIHFDGHGVFDREHGLGALCFEEPGSTALDKRPMALVHAEKLAAIVRDYRIPLVFLEACQSAQVEDDPTASVAARLLDEGVTSVVAMSHSVLVETARRFVTAFYGALAQGALVGQAMLAGQQALLGDTYRIQIMGAGALHLQDWFVPVLYQERQDPQLFGVLPPAEARRLQERQRRLSLGRLPEPPSQSFIGRSRDLLALERLLHEQPYAVVRGQGGAGKTTLAVELARWLVRSGRFKRTAFTSLETISDVRAVLDSLGRQLLPGNEATEKPDRFSKPVRFSSTDEDSAGSNYSVAQYATMKEALQPVERALRDRPTLIVLDNLESILPDGDGQAPAAAAPVEDLFALCQSLLDADPATRLLFTSRESLPTPFNHKQREVALGPLSRADAIALVSQVMAEEGLEPKATDPGQTPQEITDLVEAVNRHARALVLLARQGVTGTTADLRRLMADLDRQHPGERENSLYASLELSLRRLPPEIQDQIHILAPFHGGVNGATLDMMMDAESASLSLAEGPSAPLAAALIQVGLAHDAGYGHLRLDPALPTYLWGQLDPEAQTTWQQRWARAMRQLADFLYEQWFQDAQRSAQLTLLELPNLLALLDWTQANAAPDDVIDLTSRLETLLAPLGRPRALARVVAAREQAVQALGGWSHARFEAERAAIERLLDGGNLPAAFEAAQRLQQQCLAAGDDAYSGAAADTALAHVLLGRVLRIGGRAEAALSPLAEAQRHFEALVAAGDTNAARMASVAIQEWGDCLQDLGRLDEAAAAYEESSERKETLGDKRGVAVSKGQLGMVRLQQQRYDEALAIYTEARDTFEALGEPGTVASAWHQIGVVHREAGQFEAAERAYRQSLALEVQQSNRAGQGLTLRELGNLYNEVNRIEEAAKFYQQAIDVFVLLQDSRNEGADRSNLANVLIKLGRHDEARPELKRAIECFKPFGHAAEPWKAYAILYNLEQASGNPQAAAQAREQAVEAYLAYRRDGGESHRRGTTYVCQRVGQAIEQGQIAEFEPALPQLLEQANVSEALLPKLQAILGGARDSGLAGDSDLYYGDAAELRLLLERLSILDL